MGNSAGALAGIDYWEFPHVAKWVQKIAARPAVKRGLNVPHAAPFNVLEDDSLYKKMLAESREIISTAKAAAGK